MDCSFSSFSVLWSQGLLIGILSPRVKVVWSLFVQNLVSRLFFSSWACRQSLSVTELTESSLSLTQSRMPTCPCNIESTFQRELLALNSSLVYGLRNLNFQRVQLTFQAFNACGLLSNIIQKNIKFLKRVIVQQGFTHSDFSFYLVILWDAVLQTKISFVL